MFVCFKLNKLININKIVFIIKMERGEHVFLDEIINNYRNSSESSSENSLEAPLNLWYLDDGTVGGLPDVVARDLAALIPGLKELGLVVNSSKCELFPCSADALTSSTGLQDLVPCIKILDRLGFELLGARVLREAVPEALLGKRRILSAARKHLLQLLPHVALTLFRSCLSLPTLCELPQPGCFRMRSHFWMMISGTL